MYIGVLFGKSRTLNFCCQIAGLTNVSLQSVKDFLNDPELIILVTGRTVAGFFIFLAAIVPIYLFAITIYPNIRGALPSQSEYCRTPMYKRPFQRN